MKRVTWDLGAEFWRFCSMVQCPTVSAWAVRAIAAALGSSNDSAVCHDVCVARVKLHVLGVGGYEIIEEERRSS